MIKDKKTIEHLLGFLDASPTAWHAVANCVQELMEEGFSELKEGEQWQLKPKGRHFVIRNGSSICAFVLPKRLPKSLQIVASHTDSPGFKLKPNAEFSKENMLMLGLEIYGAPLLTSWLNRDLGIAGRVVFLDKHGKTRETRVQLENIPVVIPQLAIHLDRNVNENGLILNKQEHLAALVSTKEHGKKEKHSFLERALKHSVKDFNELLSYDLFLYPLDKARLLGEEQDLIAGYRIDSLASVHAALKGFLHALEPAEDKIKVIVFWDNEEIGSHTAQGANSPFLPQIIERITLALNLSREDYFRILSQSLCASVDLGHALHPNYSDKHDPRHVALLNKGIAVKTNAQQRYATDAHSAAAIMAICKKHKIPVQKYVTRGDIPCGTTVGPLHANLTGIPTADIGCTQLSMHSCRELMGAHDQLSLLNLIKFFLNS